MKKLSLIILIVIIALAQVVVAETVLPTHVIEVANSKSGLSAVISTMEILGIKKTETPTYREFITYEDLGFVYTEQIPLAKELQYYSQLTCSEYNLSYEILLGVIDVESDFRINATSNTHDGGLGQINRINYDWLEEELGITDVLDPYQNIRATVHILAGLDVKYDGHEIYMAYNMGSEGSRKLGASSTRYSREVVMEIEKWKVVLEGAE